jgi:hypothetical protein
MAQFKELMNSLCCLMISVSVVGQTTNFSGKWKLKEQQSIIGNLYENGVSKKMIIIQGNNNIRIEKSTLGKDNTDVITHEVFSFDGRSFESVTASKRKKSSKIKLDRARKSFVVISSLKNAIDSSKEDMKIVDTWTLNSEGNLILVRKNENYLTGEVWESRSIYVKE